ncbi:late competence development ComFB family protein [Roseateles amylovorans]|jgi:Late competence development protein ComFB|uniref:Late competence development ComFB family protein n=1 Tax=Roseateles amylovorans TaxID=2978473 RepID=A0ABY6B516_9BURK|nr:late competence development ComFB family protein [Roseateles amylovorans]UXH79937.1 late competence development ComFB family protein [Roseateles amylovorans]
MDFTSLYNHHEREVFAAVMETAPSYPAIQADAELMADVACVALNRLPPRYIRHQVDYSFYLTERERQDIDAAVKEAVESAFRFVVSRSELRQKR